MALRAASFRSHLFDLNGLYQADRATGSAACALGRIRHAHLLLVLTEDKLGADPLACPAIGAFVVPNYGDVHER